MDIGIATIAAALIAFAGVVLGFWLRLRATRQFGLTLAKYISADIIDKRTMAFRFWTRARDLVVVYADLDEHADQAAESYNLHVLLTETIRFVRDLKESGRIANSKVYESKAEEISAFPEQLAELLHRFYKDYFDAMNRIRENVDILYEFGIQEMRDGDALDVDVTHIARGLFIILDSLRLAVIETSSALKAIKDVYTSIHHPTADLG